MKIPISKEPPPFAAGCVDIFLDVIGNYISPLFCFASLNKTKQGDTKIKRRFSA